MNRQLLPALLFLFAAWTAKGQTPTQPPLKLGIGFFGATYSGDLVPKGEGIQRMYPGMNLSLQFSNKKFITPLLSGGFGKFIAQDRNLEPVDGIQPNTFVETQFFFVDFRLKARFLREKAVNPFFSLGLGMLGYTPRDANGNSLIDNTATREDNEIYGSLTASFPLSGGLEFRLSPIISIAVEYTHRWAFTDYLDNIGLLGTHNGKDRINAVTGTLFLTFDPAAMAGKLRGKDRND